MTPLNGNPAACAAREFFELQLRFAAMLAARAGTPLQHAITFNTNLHRRLGYGNVARQAPSPEFLALAEQLADAPNLPARVELTVAAFASRPKAGLPEGSATFGCFGCEAPDGEGRVRIHFSSRDVQQERSPLHASNVHLRRAELAQIVAFLLQRHPHTKSVHGGSWLYNLESYRRLFPAEFSASRMPPQGPRWLHGGSIWGQLLDYRGAVKPAMRTAFLERLSSLDPERPWDVFPLPVLKTAAAFECFVREFNR